MKGIFVFFLTYPLMGFCQPSELYYSSIKTADSLLEQKQYKDAAQMFSIAFNQNNGKGLVPHRYNAARAWAMSGHADSSFMNLERIANLGNYHNYIELINENDFNSLHSRVTQWFQLLHKVKDNQKAYYDTLKYPALAERLSEVFYNDQQYRRKFDDLQRKYGEATDTTVVTMLRKMSMADSLNTINVCKILDQHGWLGINEIGQEGNLTLFLVIQHADIQTQQKYLPLLEDAIKNGKAQKSQLAYLVDRVRLGTGKRQLYGTQIGNRKKKDTNGNIVYEYFVLPLEEPKKVDERRAEMGMGALKDYVEKWGIICEENE